MALVSTRRESGEIIWADQAPDLIVCLIGDPSIYLFPGGGLVAEIDRLDTALKFSVMALTNSESAVIGLNPKTVCQMEFQTIPRWFTEKLPFVCIRLQHQTSKRKRRILIVGAKSCRCSTLAIGKRYPLWLR